MDTNNMIQISQLFQFFDNAPIFFWPYSSEHAAQLDTARWTTARDILIVGLERMVN